MANSKNPIKRKGKSLDEALKVLSEAFPDNPIGLYGDMPKQDIKRLSTGSIDLDRKLDGGIPVGRIVEIYAENGYGKTSISLSIMAECQKDGGVVAFLDCEHALSVSYATQCGVNMDDVIFSAPETGEAAFEMITSLANTGVVDLIVVDSVAAMIPKNEIEGAMGDSLPGLQARMMSQGIKKIIHPTKTNECTVLFINQTRMDIKSGSKKPTGGRAMAYYASLRMDIGWVNQNKVEEQGEVEAHKRKITVVKSKTSKPLVSSVVTIRYGEGLDKYQEVLDMASELGLIKKGGSWYTIEGEKMQGGGNARKYLKDNPDIYNTLREKVINGEWHDEDEVETK